jgi:N-acetylneuraminic acid mutarotase
MEVIAMSKKTSRHGVALRIGLLSAVWAILALAVTTAPAVAASPNSWTAAASMSTARFGASATALLNGRVLVAGGGGYDASAEVYDPGTGTWSPTGPMTEARSNQAAVRLADGRVLVVSGDSYDAASTEIYNPAANTWSVTGKLNVARNYPAAVLLIDGRVLAVGGQNPATGAAISSAELYNPSTGTWSLTGSLRTGRYYHTATLLADGTVLVATGFNPSVANGLVAAAERYSASTGRWTSAGSMVVARRNADAVRLLDGQVLVAGGDGYGTFSSAELYDPASNSWRLTGSMTLPHGLATGTLLADGRVLIAGDTYAGDVYSPPTGTWSSTGYQVYTDLQESAGALLPNGTVLLAGGAVNMCDPTGDYCGYQARNGAQIYTP